MREGKDWQFVGWVFSRLLVFAVDDSELELASLMAAFRGKVPST